MEVQATLRHLRTSPKKVRLVADVIRGKKVAAAQSQLLHLNKGASQPMLKLLNSALANAEHNLSLAKDNLFVKEVRVDEGATLKRWMPRAHGRATTIRKRMSHVQLVLGEINPTTPKKSAKGGSASGGKKGAEAPVKKVSSKDDVKESIKKEASVPHDEKAPAGHDKEIDKHIEDPRGEGKHRHNQHSDKRSMKWQGGKTKRVFNRKAS